MLMAVCGEELPFIRPVGKWGQTVRGGGDREGGGVAREDDSLCGGPGSMLMDCRRLKEKYDYQYPQYAEKVEKYCSWR